MTKALALGFLLLATVASAVPLPGRWLFHGYLFHGYLIEDSCGFESGWKSVLRLRADGTGTMGDGRIPLEWVTVDAGWGVVTHPTCNEQCCVTATVAAMTRGRRSDALLALDITCDTLSCSTTYIGRIKKAGR